MSEEHVELQMYRLVVSAKVIVLSSYWSSSIVRLSRSIHKEKAQEPDSHLHQSSLAAP